jgi:hypothetical protein
LKLYGYILAFEMKDQNGDINGGGRDKKPNHGEWKGAHLRRGLLAHVVEYSQASNLVLEAGASPVLPRKLCYGLECRAFISPAMWGFE